MMTSKMTKNQIFNFLKLCFTGKDNQTPDLGRILLTLSFIVYFALAITDVIFTHDFEYLQFGEGLGVLFAGGGLHLYLKKSTEPEV